MWLSTGQSPSDVLVAWVPPLALRQQADFQHNGFVVLSRAQGPAGPPFLQTVRGSLLSGAGLHMVLSMCCMRLGTGNRANHGKGRCSGAS